MASSLASERIDLPYRPSVGIMLINRYGLVWLGRRAPKWFEEGEPSIWQMPQGGIDRGEEPAVAALRELCEETNVTSAQILGESAGWITYELPEHLLGVALKGKYRGQRQKWFAIRFTGCDSEIDIQPRKGHKQEFDAWQWVSGAEVTTTGAPIRREVYTQVVAEFSAHLR